MKINLSAKPCLTAALALTGLMIGGCVKDNGANGGAKVPDAPVFDFSSRTTSTLQVQYDVPQGYRVYFEVYTENPEYLNADEQIVKKDIDPVDVGFTDENGKYSLPLSVTAATDKVYVYSPYAGVPRVLTADVVANGVSEARVPAIETASAQQAGTRMEDYEYYNEIREGYNNVDFKRLGIWKNADSYMLNGVSYKQYGRPDYLLSEKVPVSADLLALVSQTLPEGGGVNADLIQNGDIHITQETNIDLFLIDEVTGSLNTLAYYCYDTNNPPATASDLKDLAVIFPNAQVFKTHTLNPLPILKGNNGAVERGEGVRLHYWKDGKDMGTTFPANTSIGWVLYNKSYQSAALGNGMLITVRFYGSKKLNEFQGENTHAALFRNGETVLMGFEDWFGSRDGDNDYNDLVFQVKASNIEAIIPGIPDVDPEPPTEDEVAASVTYRGILAFEDLWPSRGDFDMNDVVIGYESTVGYNVNNEVLQTNDKFTVMHSGASIDNSFSYQLGASRGEVDIEITSSRGGNGGAYVDQTLEPATVRLANNVLAYANAPTKTVFDVVTKYIGGRPVKGQFTNPPYNPFITTKDKSVEVHLTNKRPTEALNKSLLGYGHDRSNPDLKLYYITYDEQNVQMPFAIDIAFNTAEEMATYVIPAETKRIDTHYPAFINWIVSGGTQDKDWYLRPKN